MSGGLLVFDLESEAAVKAVMDSDIYSKNGIWTGNSIKKLNRVLFEAPVDKEDAISESDIRPKVQH